MIRYALQCAKGHDFEAWFRSSSDYDAQHKKRIVSCPQCGSLKVEKALMAPSLGTRSNRRQDPSGDATPAGTAKGSGIAATGLPDAVRKHVTELAREIRQHVVANADDVGDRFAQEARKIHYEETPARGIYGRASPAEARDLVEEGIEIAPLPSLPEDKN